MLSYIWSLFSRSNQQLKKPINTPKAIELLSLKDRRQIFIDRGDPNKTDNEFNEMIASYEFVNNPDKIADLQSKGAQLNAFLSSTKRPTPTASITREDNDNRLSQANTSRQPQGVSKLSLDLRSNLLSQISRPKREEIKEDVISEELSTNNTIPMAPPL